MTNQPYTVRLAQWLFAQEWYEAEYRKARDELFPEGVPELSGEDREKFEIFVNQWIQYDRPTSRYGKKPIELFIETVKNPIDRAIFQQFSSGWLGAFEILDIRQLESLALRDLVTDKRYEVSEQQGTIGPAIGDVLFARILPLGERHILAAGFGLMTGSVAHSLIYTFRRLRASNQSSPLNPPDLAHFLFARSATRTNMKWEAIINLDVFLKDRGYEVQSAADVARQFEHHDSPNQVISQLAKTLKLTAKKDIELFTALLINLWNLYQAKPAVDGIIGPGPIEVTVIEDMLHTIQRKQEKVEIKNEADARRFGDTAKEQYLHTSQTELGGKTPWETILEERRSRGDSDQSFHYEMTVHAFESPQHDREKLFNTTFQAFAKKNFKAALRGFEEIIALGEHQIPEIWRIYGNAAVCAYNLGDLKQAEMYLKKSLALNPDYELAKKHLADLKARKKQLKKD